MIGLLTKFAQSSSYNYDYSSTTTTADPAATAMGLVVMSIVFILIALVYVFSAICYAKIFKKAGRQDSWAAWIPVYNMYVFFEVAGRPGWWAFLAFIPIVGGIASLVTTVIGSLDMAKSFGKEVGFGILLILLPLIGLPMLAFGDATYNGPAGPEGGAPAAPQLAPQPTQQPPQTPQPPTQPLV